jgi:adenylate cyclase
MAASAAGSQAWGERDRHGRQGDARRNAELVDASEPPFEISVGVHYGPVVIARLGGPTQAQITAAGDTVNVASRIEKLTRAHGAAIAISDAVVAATRRSGRTDLLEGFQPIAAQSIRGRVGRPSIWIKRDVSERGSRDEGGH